MDVGRKPITTFLMGKTHIVAARFAAGSGRPKCDGVTREPIASDTEEGQGAADALTRLAATKTVRGTEVRAVLPRHRVTTRVVSLPSTNPSEIARMVRLEADRYVPYPIEELVLDHAVLGTSDEGFSTVLVVLVHRDEVNAILQPLGKARVKDISVTISSLALYNAYLASSDGDDLHAGIVHVGIGGLDVIAVERGELTFMRGVPWSGDWHALDPVTEGVETNIIREVRASIDSRRRAVPGETPLSKLYLTGEVAGLDRLRDRLAAEMDIDVDMLGDVSTGSAAPGPVASGAVVSPGKVSGAVTINLLPEEYVTGISRSSQIKRLAVAAVLAFIAMLLGVRVSIDRAEEQRKYLDFLNAEIKLAEPVKELVQVKQQRVRAVHSRLDRGFTALEFLAKIHELAPADMVFEDIDFTRDSHALIKAVARDRSIPFAYADRLRQSGVDFLEKAESGSTGVSSQRGQTVISFEVLIPFVSDTELLDETEKEMTLE